MIKELTMDEALEVVGGGLVDDIRAGVVGYVIGVVIPAVVNVITGPSNTCTSTGATKGGPICPPPRR